MRLKRPKRGTWIVALVLGVVGTFTYLYSIPGLSDFSFWMVLLGLLLMLFSTASAGL